MDTPLMIYNIIFASLSLAVTIVVFYLLLKITKEIANVSRLLEIKSVKLDIIENMLSVGIYVADASGRWTYVNNTMAILLGMQPSEMVNNGWLRNLMKREEVHKKWMNAITNQLPYSDVITVNIQGRQTQFELTTLPVLTDGNYSAYVGTIKPVPGM